MRNLRIPNDRNRKERIKIKQSPAEYLKLKTWSYRERGDDKNQGTGLAATTEYDRSQEVIALLGVVVRY